MCTEEPFLPRPRHKLIQNTCSSAGVVFDSQLHHNLAVYVPDVNPGPIAAIVTVIYSAVSSTARPGVIRAYVKSVGHFGFKFYFGRCKRNVAGLCFPYGCTSRIFHHRWSCTDKVGVSTETCDSPFIIHTYLQKREFGCEWCLTPPRTS